MGGRGWGVVTSWRRVGDISSGLRKQARAAALGVAMDPLVTAVCQDTIFAWIEDSLGRARFGNPFGHGSRILMGKRVSSLEA